MAIQFLKLEEKGKLAILPLWICCNRLHWNTIRVRNYFSRTEFLCSIIFIDWMLFRMV